MKKIISILGLIYITLIALSCGDIEELDPSNLTGPIIEEGELEEGSTGGESIPSREFPVVATIDGERVNFFSGTVNDEATSIDLGGSSFVTFTTADDSNFTAAKFSISIIIDREDLKRGENDLSITSGLGGSTGLNLVDLSKVSTGNVFFPVSGNLTITQIDTTQGIVAGTFNLTLNETVGGASTGKTVMVTDGEFRFSYEVL